MGFGHRVYKNFDPRAKIIKEACHALLKKLGVNDPLLELAMRLEEVALRDEYFIERKLYPNVDYYSGIIMRALGIPTNMFTVMFAIGRLPGWIAHWREVRIGGTAASTGRGRSTPAPRSARSCPWSCANSGSRRRSAAMNVLMVCSELAPLAKTGGLADAVTGLSDALAARGHDVRVLLPQYAHLPPADSTRRRSPAAVGGRRVLELAAPKSRDARAGKRRRGVPRVYLARARRAHAGTASTRRRARRGPLPSARRGGARLAGER